MGTKATEILFEIVPPVLGVLLMVWSGFVVFRGVVAPRLRRGRSTCGRCGHEIVLPIPERCQECGSGLLEVGVCSPALAAKLRGGTIRLVLAWLMFSFFLGIAVRGVAFGLLTSVLRPTHTVSFTQSFAVVIPGTTPLGPLELTVSGGVEQELRGGSRQNGVMSVQVSGPGAAQAPLSAQVWTSLSQRDTQVWLGAGVQRHPGEPTVADAAAMLGAVDPRFKESPSLAPHAQAIAGIFKEVAHLPNLVHESVNRSFAAVGLPPVSLTGGYTASSDVFSARLPFLGPVRAETLAWVPAGGLMLVGSVWVARRHRKLTRAMRAVPAST